MTDGRIDAFFDLGGAARALSLAPASIAVRALEPAGASAEAGYAPLPARDAELPLTRGASRDAIASIEIRTRTLGWSFERAAGEIVVKTDGGARELVVAQAIAASPKEAEADLAPLLDALTAYATNGETSTAEASAEAASKAAPGFAPRFRFALEGDAIVLRDAEDRGPRERVARYRGIALLLVVLGLLATIAVVDRIQSSAGALAIVGAAIPPVVLLVGAFAMNEIARHASRYRAGSAPLASFADDRVVVAPWVSRDGAIDPKPEGRLGAAIACGEIGAVEVRPRDGAHAVTLDGLHGPMEVVLTRDASTAEALRIAIEGTIARVASPKRRMTALMRAAATREQARSAKSATT